MGQKKLLRFEEIKSFPNVLQFPQDIQGKWHAHFGNKNPITLELACGKGEYAVGLGVLYPNRNFIGIDLKGNRIWVGAKQALSQGLQNVAFLRTQIDMADKYFEPGEVHEIWITFPDPQLRNSKSKKRLTHPRFLRLYHQFLNHGGSIHLKTDSPELYRFTKTVIELYGLRLHEDIGDLYAMEDLKDEFKIRTHYESLDIAQSSRVHYLRFSLPASLPGTEMDHQLKMLMKDDESTGIN